MQLALQAVLRCQRSNRLAAIGLSKHMLAPRTCRTLPLCREIATSTSSRKKQETQPPQIQNYEKEPHSGAPKKQSRAAAGKKTSLRRVAVEAATLIRTRGKTRFVDPNAERKSIDAFCAAETYDIRQVAQLMVADGFAVDPFHTGLEDQVVHVQTPIYPVSILSEDEENIKGYGDLFIFPSGTVVAWNVPDRVSHRVVTQVLKPAAENSHVGTMETEYLEYIEDNSAERSVIYGDTIVLATAAGPLSSSPYHLDSSSIDGHNKLSDLSQHSPKDITLAKIAFSSGLAASTKLAVLESLLFTYIDSTRDIPKALAQPRGQRFTRSFILGKTGELLSIRAQLNLYSELTDSLPDLFWDSKHELGLEGYYVEVGKALDVSSRIDALNNKMDYASEIATVLRERLSERHGLALEWGIIALIAVEVVIEMWRTWREWDPPAEKGGQNEADCAN